MTWPLPLRFASALPEGSYDLWHNYWNLWWWKRCLLELHQSPFHTNMLFHPTGVGLVFYTHSISNMLLSLPVNWLVGTEAAYNACLFWGFWAAGWFMFLLARELTGNAAAALVAGVIFAYFPQRMERSFEQLNLFSVQYMTLAVFFLRRVVMTGGARNTAGLTAAYVLNALTDWHLSLKLTMLLVVCFLAWVRRSPRGSRPVILDCSIVALAAEIALMPVRWPMLHNVVMGDVSFQKEQENHGLDLSGLVLPHFLHPVAGWATAPVYAFDQRPYLAAGFVCYIGIISVILAPSPS